MSPRHEMPPEIEDFRDQCWRREGARQIETAIEAERFIERVGFAACLTDSRRPGPSLYVAVCGRRDAVLPRDVQKDSETSLTWVLKDEMVRRGKVYYAKLARGKTMFVAPRLVPAFRAVWGMTRAEEKTRLTTDARAILKVLRREWEMGTADLREESGVADRKRFTRARSGAPWPGPGARPSLSACRGGCRGRLRARRWRRAGARGSRLCSAPRAQPHPSCRHPS